MDNPANSPLASSLLMAALEGPSLTDKERECFKRVRPAGVTLFKRNLAQSPSQIRSLIKDIQATRAKGAPPLLIAIDQEGGRVSRLSDVVDLGPPMELFPGVSEGSLSSLKDYGFKLGSALKELGINLNFAPVLDVLSRESNLAIGDRSFSRDPKEAHLRAGAFLHGMQKAGIYGCLKHFPGQGDAPGDTHLDSFSIDASWETLQNRELVPFMALLKDCPFVMSSHCVYESLSDKPASLSKEVLKDLLRDRLGYEGLVVSDDMNMKAIPQSSEGFSQAISSSVLAGNDLILVCQGLSRIEMAAEALCALAQREPLFQEIVTQKAAKILAIRKTLG